MRDTLNKVIELSSDFSEPASEINREGRNLSIFLKYQPKFFYLVNQHAIFLKYGKHI